MTEFLTNDGLIFFLLIIAAAVLAGFLAGLFGVGGGAVMVPVFSEVFVLAGTEPAQAQFVAVGTSLAVIVPTSIRSAITHYEKRSMDLATARKYLWFVPIGVILGLGFANLSWVEESDMLTALFGVVALLLAVYMLAQAREFRLSEGGPKTPFAQLGAIVIGFVSSLMGIGGGVMNNIFMMVQGTPIKRAIGTSAAVGTLIAIPGAIGFAVIGFNETVPLPLTIGYVNLLTVLIVIPVTTALAPLGARAVHRLPDRLTSRLFAGFLLIVSLRMLWKVFL